MRSCSLFLTHNNTNLCPPYACISLLAPPQLQRPPQAAAAGLLAALSGLAAPGSRVYFDFMSQDALDGRGNFPGFKVTRKVGSRHLQAGLIQQ